MTRILLSGCGGKMCRVIAGMLEQRDDCEVVAGFDVTAPQLPFPVFANPADCKIQADVVIDFSHPGALEGVLSYCMRSNAALILCTTGYTKPQDERIARATKEIPLFRSANMSLGINLLMRLAKEAAARLSGFDIEIIEQHHNQKIDAPSGTALALADAINDAVFQGEMAYTYDRHSVRKARSKKEIGLHSIRGGNIAGTHEVLFAGQSETISLTHVATSKDVFAAGAIEAAFFMAGKPIGLYSMSDLLSE